MEGQAYTRAQAQGYEDEDEHALPVAEIAVWLREIEAFDLPRPARVLDFGAGTGALLGALKRHGFAVKGLEPSTAMIDRGLALHPDLTREDFVLGGAEDASLFGEGTFDLVVSRQVLCHLDQPDAVFASFRAWLRPGGKVILVDGYWKSFPDAHKRQCPLAGLTSAAPVSDCLEAAGFQILRAGTWAALNAARRSVFLASEQRFIVVGGRN